MSKVGRIIACLGLVFALLAERDAAAQQRLQRTSPEAQGVSSECVASFLDSVQRVAGAELHSLVLMRHGAVISEAYFAPFRAEDAHTLFSVSKTFVAAAVGLCVEDGLLDVDDRLCDILGNCPKGGIEDVTVEHLLTMTAGISPSFTLRDTSEQWVRDYLHRPMASAAGGQFAYDSMVSYLLSAVVSKVAGCSALELLQRRLFGPMGIEEAHWEVSPEGISCGGWGLWLRAESQAKFGQLLLQRGRWSLGDGEERQLLSAQWVDQMMEVRVDTMGYGFQMWRCKNLGTMRADGLHGQFIIVMPKEDMVCVVNQCITAAAPGHEEMRLLFDNVARKVKDGPLEENRRALRWLRRMEEACAVRLETEDDGEWENLGKVGEAMEQGADLQISVDSVAKAELRARDFTWTGFRLRKRDKSLWLSIEEMGHTERKLTGEWDRQPLAEAVEMECGQGRWVYTKVPREVVPHPRGSVRRAYEGLPDSLTVAARYAVRKDGGLRIDLCFVDWISRLSIDMDWDTRETAENGRLENIEEWEVKLRNGLNYRVQGVELRGRMRLAR